VRERNVATIAAYSRSALDRPLCHSAELRVTVVADSAIVVGAFGREIERPGDLHLERRGSGGPIVRVGPGTVHVALNLAHPGVLVGANSRNLVNRAVRPLLRAITRGTKGMATASYFGRDWVSVAHRPAAWVGFAHDTSTRRALFEAFVAVSTPIAFVTLPSFLGKEAITLEVATGQSINPTQLAVAIVDSYSCEQDATSVDEDDGTVDMDPTDWRIDPPWTATCDEAIGRIGAGVDATGTFRIGGDLLVSRDAIERLAARAAASTTELEISQAVDEELTAPGIALEGVRSLRSIRDVAARACGLDGSHIHTMISERS
jgi:hypothetical protein